MADFMLRLSATLAVITGSIGFVLALFAWKFFSGAPFGRALAILVPYMAAFTIYHALLIIIPSLSLLALVIESLAFALLVIFVGFMIRLHHQRLRKPSKEVSSK